MQSSWRFEMGHSFLQKRRISSPITLASSLKPSRHDRFQAPIYSRQFHHKLPTLKKSHW